MTGVQQAPRRVSTGGQACRVDRQAAPSFFGASAIMGRTLISAVQARRTIILTQR